MKAKFGIKNMNEVIPFSFEGNGIRIVMKGDVPWFVAKDVTDLLEISNTSDALSRLDDDERDLGEIITNGGRQTVAIVNESGVYALVFTSRKEQARKFRKWVTDTVLPKIRKTGNFSLSGGMSRDWIERIQRIGGFNHQTHFSVFEEVDYLIGRAFIVSGIRFPDTGDLSQTPRPDISVGRMWADKIKNRSDHEEILRDTIMYQHWTPAKTIEARAYPIRIIGDFRAFVLNDWLTGRMPYYFSERISTLVPYMPQLEMGVKKMLSQMGPR